MLEKKEASLQDYSRKKWDVKTRNEMKKNRVILTTERGFEN